jgi:hypothetical protein
MLPARRCTASRLDGDWFFQRDSDMDSLFPVPPGPAASKLLEVVLESSLDSIKGSSVYANVLLIEK